MTLFKCEVQADEAMQIAVKLMIHLDQSMVMVLSLKSSRCSLRSLRSICSLCPSAGCGTNSRILDKAMGKIKGCLKSCLLSLLYFCFYCYVEYSPVQVLTYGRGIILVHCTIVLNDYQRKKIIKCYLQISCMLIATQFTINRYNISEFCTFI